MSTPTASNTVLFPAVKQGYLAPKHVLKAKGIPYAKDGGYLNVGKPVTTHGWIIHISVVWTELVAAVEKVAATLYEHDIPFKVPELLQTAQALQDGNYGIEMVGKTITAFPYSDEAAKKAVDALLPVVSGFDGPAILTDAYIDACVYVRYGAHQEVYQIDEQGNNRVYYLVADNQLRLDEKTIPYHRPEGVDWPFDQEEGIRFPDLPDEQICKIANVLKVDPKGNVFDGIYMDEKGIEHPCIIKQGNRKMCLDAGGKDIYDRLDWQYRLQQMLMGKVRVPKPYALLKNANSWFLVMEKINGVTVIEKANAINHRMERFSDLSADQKGALLQLSLDLVDAVDRLHQKGIVHRDIQPGNFLIDEQDRVCLIDIELAYSIKLEYPDRPFEMGTPGYMSPEQMAVKLPTVKEDIYGLCSLLLLILGQINPNTVTGIEEGRMQETLEMLTGNRIIAALFIQGRQQYPDGRPDIPYIKEQLELIRLGGGYISVEDNCAEKIDKGFIERALIGLIQEPVVMHEGHWTMPQPIMDRRIKQSGTLTVEPTFHNGVTGTAYLIAKAKMAGYEADGLKTAFQRNIVYAFSLLNQSGVPVGLNFGKAGMALVLAAGIEVEYLENNEPNIKTLKGLISVSSDDLTVGTGLAGVGMALLEIRKYYTDEEVDVLHSAIINKIFLAQHKDGCWIEAGKDIRRGDISLSMTYGNAGIIMYVLEYQRIYRDAFSAEIIRAYFDHLDLLTTWQEKTTVRGLLGYGGLAAENLLGIIKLYIRGYEVTGMEAYLHKYMVLLNAMPERIIGENFSFDSGICGLGDVYTCAYVIDKNTIWKARMEWISSFIYMVHKMNSGRGIYWNVQNKITPETGLTSGSAGILMYLIKNMHGHSYKL